MLENGQFTNSSLIGIDECSLILTARIKAFDGVKLGNIEVAGNLTEVAMLVSEHATTTIAALLLFVEGTAVFGSKFFFGICCGLIRCEFFFSVSELTFFPVAAAVIFDPVFAQFSLVLLSCDLHFILALLGGCQGLLRCAGRVCCWGEDRLLC